jgi:actin-related protein
MAEDTWLEKSTLTQQAELTVYVTEFMAEDTQLEKSTLTQQALLATYSMSVSCLA